MQPAEFEPIFEKIKNLRIGVIGDFAVDFYFDLQENTGETSLETGRTVEWGTHPRTSLGAAGNVVQNLSALGVGELNAFGALGSDVYGRELLYLLQENKVDTTGLICPDENWDTCTYTKPMHQGQEQNRLDFGTNNRLEPTDFGRILEKLEAQMPRLDVLIINQQFSASLIDRTRVANLNILIARYDHVNVLADMRAHGLALRGSTLKVNTSELAQLLNVGTHHNWTDRDCADYAKVLAESIRGPVLLTRGAHGLFYTDGRAEHFSPAVLPSGPIDPVGAGDTAVAAFAACLGAKVAVPTALAITNLAAAVTVQKLHQTGTASSQEIMQLLAST